MHPSLSRLLDVLRPRPVEAHLYEAVSVNGEGGHLFGGQVMAQAMAAANYDLPGATAHSLHAYFLRRGTPAEPIRFRVESLRASRRFRTLEVVASQQGQPILQVSISYHEPESGPVHQIPMDDVGPPQGEAYERALLQAMTPEGFSDEGTPFELPVEIRGVGGVGLFSTDVKPPQARCWMRVRDRLPDDLAYSSVLHQWLFAYASDYAIMVPALNPHPCTITSLQSASLDHAIWFHRPFRMDEWLLFELDSPIASGARGLGRGLLYKQDGTLVASCVQEILLRPLTADPA
jgi:acyl-CoA thioesterase-2